MRYRSAIFGLALSLCVANVGFAQAVKSKDLFDGKTLKGWSGDPKFWSVEDGAITGITTADVPTKGNTFCVWDGEVADFELKFDYRIQNHNSGVQFRSFKLKDAADQWRIGGYQADCDADNKWSGTLYGEKFRGILAKRGESSVITGSKMSKGKRPKLTATRDVKAMDGADKLASHIKAWPAWNTYKVVAKGFRFQLYINDKLMSECEDKDEAQRKAKGLLALQLHGGPPMKVQFKNIQLKNLGSATGGKATAKTTFEDDFENGMKRWELVDPKSWKLEDHGKGKSLSITQRESDYKPKVRSPRHIALMKDVSAASFELTFKVKSTKNTGNHRDCCVFFNYQDPTHFYYVHLGAKPDPHSGQIMIVKDAPRLALTKNQKLTPWSESDWHQVKLVRDHEAGTIAIYFDDMDTPHMQTNDKTFGAGRIGLGSFDDMDAFDDVKLVVK